MGERVRRARRAVAAALAALALGAAVGSVAGCTAGAPDDGARAAPAGPVPTRASAPATPPAPRFGTYVALGDSYTAAPLVPRTELAQGCLRSSGNYAALVARRLPGTRLTDVSCSAARTASMTHAQRIGDGRVPPQLDALTRRTGLVTLGIGGNDFDLFEMLVGTCTRLRADDPTGAPCRDWFGGPAGLADRLAGVRRHVAGVVEAIRARAPHATVVVVGYPQIVPAHGTCPRRLPLAAGDYPWARTVSAGLAEAVRRGAREADAYVDLYRHSRGHDICSDRPWVNGRVTDVNRALAYHPFAVEQAAAARLVLAALR